MKTSKFAIAYDLLEEKIFATPRQKFLPKEVKRHTE